MEIEKDRKYKGSKRNTEPMSSESKNKNLINLIYQIKSSDIWWFGETYEKVWKKNKTRGNRYEIQVREVTLCSISGKKD